MNVLLDGMLRFNAVWSVLVLLNLLKYSGNLSPIGCMLHKCACVYVYVCVYACV